MYLSRDPSKNITAAKVKAYHAHGIGVLLNWEDQAGAPLQGADKGKSDAAAAVLQARGLGAPHDVCIYFSCDTDTNPSQYKAINAYYRAAGKVVHAAGFRLGCYGEADLVAHLSAAGITDAEWQTLAWSGGRLDPAADFYQTGINGHLGGAAVDYDRIIHPAQLGAWWPANSPNVQEDDMSDAQVQQILKAIADIPHDVWAFDNDGDTRAWALLNVGANTTRFAKALVAALPPAQRGGLTEADMETAVRKVLDDAKIQVGD
jgi:hypothetical protein